MHIRISAVATLAMILNMPVERAQSAAEPRFEVVSIKPCRDDAPRGRSGNTPPSGPTATLIVNCQTALRLIEQAYDTYATGRLKIRANPSPIEGAPAWTRSERYTIEAKAESPQGRAIMRGPMMQQILEDRFKLKLRRVLREVPVYLLTVAKGGPKNLEPAKPGSCVAWDLDHMPLPAPGQPEPSPCGMIGRRIHADTGIAEVEVPGTTLPNLAEQLTILVDRDVIDKTGIAGTFDIRVEIPVDELTVDAPDRRDDATPKPPSDEVPLGFATARKLGLKLEPGKGPGEILVIDHIERPSEN